jgi:AcrR family transcriptional regulator
MSDTRARLLDTAERLFGEQGFDATSLRQIIAEAGVNLAAIHYHFGSKQELLDALVMRKAGPVNEERLAMLERAEAEAGAQGPSLKQVLEAFFSPMVRVADQHVQFTRLMGRIYAEGQLLPVVHRNFQPVIARFVLALRRALPELPDAEFHWRIHFMIGAMAHTLCGKPEFTQATNSEAGFPERIGHLIRFLIGGFRAPASQASAPTEPRIEVM